MGFGAAGSCFPTALAALSAACQHYPDANFSQAFYTYSCTGVLADFSGLQITRLVVGGSPVLMNVEVPLPYCDALASFADYSYVWVALVSAAGVVWLARRLFTFSARGF